MQWYDWFRLGIVLVALTALYLSARRANYLWNDFTARLKDLWWVQTGFLILTVVGMLEQIIQDVSWGLRTFLSFLLVLLCLRGQLRDEGYIQSEDGQHKLKE